jgi:bacterioferritin-associated ferredoxin
MIVCICKNITEKQIKEEIKKGNDTIEKLQKACGVGDDCLRCLKSVKQILKESK